LIRNRSEFEDLLPVELKEAIEAYNEKEKRKWVRDAWFTALIMMCFVGKRIDFLSLLPSWVSPKKILTKEEQEKELKELKKRLKIKA